MHTPLLTISRRLRCTRCGERKAHARPEPRTSAITARWHQPQLSQRCLPSFSTIARCACFQASSLGLRMPAHPPSMMPRLALAGKPRGVVAIGAGRGYIWAMDEKDISERLGPPARIVRLKDRMLSSEWRCSSCGLTVEDIIPIPVPAPCPKCSGIAFEAIEPSDD